MGINAANKHNAKKFGWRFYFLSLLLLLILFGLICRIVNLGLIKRDFLLKEGANRSIRDIEIPAHRGKISDRNGEILAQSVLIDSVWANPKIVKATPEQLLQISQALNLPLPTLEQKLFGEQTKNGKNRREFVYLKRHITEEASNKIKELKIPGIFLQKEYQRYYPDAEVASQIIGLTNIDDKGQEGLELAYDSWLRGTPGKQRVVKDRLGNTITELETVASPQPGHDLVLSLDRRIQYLAYQELKSAVIKDEAESGIAVVISVKTGEILAMVSAPTCNPNDRTNVNLACYKNKAITDLFEPGSTIKSFTIASALASGQYTKDSIVDTNPGHIKVGKKLIYDDDHRNNGVLTVTGVLKKSSDVGVTKIALSLPPDNLLNLLKSVGFGHTTQSGFPGEATGVIPASLKGKPLTLATISYGYGISVTALQLAHAYTTIASGGISRMVSLLKLDKEQIAKAEEGMRVMPQKVANDVLAMLQSVLELGGTGKKARIQGYNVAGKTGTAQLAKAHGYYSDRHGALFAGIAPASNPELVTVIVIKNPRGLYKGGSVAAPVFANIMHGALRILSIPPDAEQEEEVENTKKTATKTTADANEKGKPEVIPPKNLTEKINAIKTVKTEEKKIIINKKTPTKKIAKLKKSSRIEMIENEKIIDEIMNSATINKKILDEKTATSKQQNNKKYYAKTKKNEENIIDQ